MYRVSEIWIYPVKSLGGMRCREALALEKGFEHDRRWMLIDTHNRFLTQREYPQMALFSVELNHHTLKVTHRSTAQDIEFETSLQSSVKLNACIWNDEAEVYEVDKKVSEWFSRQLGFSCRLVKFPEENKRPADKKFVPEPKHISLADAFPYLIIGQSSLDELNRRLAKPVTMQRFRPNLVFIGGKSFSEDNWNKFSIGSVVFEAVKPCARCVLTTVDPVTAEKGKEPLHTLSQFRRQNNHIMFGMNLVAYTQGIIREGDAIILHQ